MPTPPGLSTAMDIDELLERTAQEAAEAAEAKSRAEAKADRDRGRDRDRDRERDAVRPHRDSRKEYERSHDRHGWRRDGSRPRSSYRDVDTDEDNRSRRGDRHRERSRDRHYRRDDRRDDRRGGDYYNGSGRARSRSPRRDDRDTRRSSRDHSRERRRYDYHEERSHYYHDERSHYYHDDRSRYYYEERPRQRVKTPTPPPDDDKDYRTVFVTQIANRAETRHLRQFFARAGTVVDAKIVVDRVTGRSKGVGYVEFKSEESIKKAIELTGQRLKGIPIIAAYSEAEKNRQSRASDAANSNGNGAPFHRLYVGNIHFSVTEQDIRAVFEPFGELEQITLQKDENNPQRSKGYGFVQYAEPEAAKSALEQMNGFDLAGRPIRVGLGNDKFTPESTASLLRNFNQNAQNFHGSSSFQGSAFSGAGGRGIGAGGSSSMYSQTHGRDNRGVTGASALDDTDVAGININNMNRDRLMNLLARKPVDDHNKDSKGAPAVTTSKPPTFEPMPSRCIKIEDAFNAEEELRNSGVDWMKSLEKEVGEECDVRYGKVVHIAIDASGEGEIYVKFADLLGSEKALQGLNGRTFNFRRIRASYVIDTIYNSLWGTAASKH